MKRVSIVLFCGARRSLACAMVAVAGAFRAKLRRDHFHPDAIARLSAAHIAELKVDSIEDPRSAHFISGL
jgi:hypothetical protein